MQKQKLTITEYTAQGGRYVRQELEVETEFVEKKEAIRRQLRIVYTCERYDGSDWTLIVYKDAAGAYFYAVTSRV